MKETSVVAAIPSTTIDFEALETKVSVLSAIMVDSKKNSEEYVRGFLVGRGGE
jgi:hypothetical protein